MRVPDPTDRRVVSISLTKKAEKIYHLMQKHKETVLKEMLSRLSDADKKSLERIITILIKD
jgi:DNA-binding MarR family transcriptional regulator